MLLAAVLMPAEKKRKKRNAIKGEFCLNFGFSNTKKNKRVRKTPQQIEAVLSANPTEAPTILNP